MAANFHAVDPKQVAQALRTIADEIEAGKGGQRNLCVVMHTQPVYDLGPAFPPIDLVYLGETIVLTHRPLPPDCEQAVERFFYGAAQTTWCNPSDFDIKRQLEESRERMERMIPPPCYISPGLYDAIASCDEIKDNGSAEAEAQAEFFRKSILAE